MRIERIAWQSTALPVPVPVGPHPGLVLTCCGVVAPIRCSTTGATTSTLYAGHDKLPSMIITIGSTSAIVIGQHTTGVAGKVHGPQRTFGVKHLWALAGTGGRIQARSLVCSSWSSLLLLVNWHDLGGRNRLLGGVPLLGSLGRWALRQVRKAIGCPYQ